MTRGGALLAALIVAASAASPARATSLATADLAVSAAAGRAEVNVGDEVSVTVRVTNHGPEDASRSVLTLAVPPGLVATGLPG